MANAQMNSGISDAVGSSVAVSASRRTMAECPTAAIAMNAATSALPMTLRRSDARQRRTRADHADERGGADRRRRVCRPHRFRALPRIVAWSVCTPVPVCRTRSLRVVRFAVHGPPSQSLRRMRESAASKLQTLSANSETLL